jgi:hypothetical protein
MFRVSPRNGIDIAATTVRIKDDKPLGPGVVRFMSCTYLKNILNLRAVCVWLIHLYVTCSRVQQTMLCNGLLNRNVFGFVAFH